MQTPDFSGILWLSADAKFPQRLYWREFSGLWIYATDVAKYTLLVSFAEFFDQISGGDGRFRRPL
jgi:hypothetical protein